MADFTLTINADEKSIGIQKLDPGIFTRLKSRLFSIFSDATSPIIKEIAEDLKDEIHRSMKLPKTGRMYRRRKGWHQASAPGEAPAIEEGDLYNSVKIVSKSRLEASVIADTPYTLALEYGHDYGNGRVLLPRPFMQPAVIAIARQRPGVIGASRKTRT